MKSSYDRIAALTQVVEERPKKKGRWKRSEKTAARKRREVTSTDMLAPPRKHTGREKGDGPAPNCRLMRCYRNGQYTKALYKKEFGNGETISSPSVATSCLSPEELEKVPFGHESTPTIFVKPLIVLDLNGILCHRVKTDRDPLASEENCRPSSGWIGRTPIIPRPDLDEFLSFLVQHFCLAIWTSAKKKTAVKLIKSLIPDRVKSRLLFTWNQSMCSMVRCEKETVFEKDLVKVWQRFPLWSDKNTLLVDDSRDKSVQRACGLHPAPLHGRKASHATVMSDEENAQLQLDFFRKLVDFWKVAEVNGRIAGKGGIVEEEKGYAEFLEEHAARHMGWSRY